jgi:hypothetical protein
MKALAVTLRLKLQPLLHLRIPRNLYLNHLPPIPILSTVIPPAIRYLRIILPLQIVLRRRLLQDLLLLIVDILPIITSPHPP